MLLARAMHIRSLRPPSEARVVCPCLAGSTLTPPGSPFFPFPRPCHCGGRLILRSPFGGRAANGTPRTLGRFCDCRRCRREFARSQRRRMVFARRYHFPIARGIICSRPSAPRRATQYIGKNLSLLRGANSAAAVVCRYCGSSLEGGGPVDQIIGQPFLDQQEPKKPSSGIVPSIVSALLVLALIIGAIWAVQSK